MRAADAGVVAAAVTLPALLCFRLEVWFVTLAAQSPLLFDFGAFCVGLFHFFVVVAVAVVIFLEPI